MENVAFRLSKLEIGALLLYDLELQERQKHSQCIGGGLKKIGHGRTLEKWEKMQYEYGYR
jgi:hypothetical protein